SERDGGKGAASCHFQLKSQMSLIEFDCAWDIGDLIANTDHVIAQDRLVARVSCFTHGASGHHSHAEYGETPRSCIGQILPSAPGQGSVMTLGVRAALQEFH